MDKDSLPPLLLSQSTTLKVETNQRVQQLIKDLYQGNHIDEMSNKWLCQTRNMPRIQEFYSLTKIHKPTPVGGPITSGCDG